MSRSVELLAAIIETIRTAWTADADFAARGTVVSAPRVRHHQAEAGQEFVDAQFGRIEKGDEISASPIVNSLEGVLIFAGIVDAGVRSDPLYLGDPAAAAVLEQLVPLATLLETKIENALRQIEIANESVRFWEYADAEPIVSTEGGRLRAAIKFRYLVAFLVEASVEDEEVVDFAGADIDWTLQGGGAATPHAEDDETY